MEQVRILLVDDHAIVRAGIRNALEEMPAVSIVGELSDGLALLPAIARLRPNCLLIDVTMPNFEPIQAVKEIRAMYPSLKILIVSAFDDDAYVQGLFNAGVNGYHLKDQSLRELRLAVERVMSGQRWLSDRLLDRFLSHASHRPKVAQLTSRQQEILLLLQNGYDNSAIAKRIGISIKTVENHLTRVYRLLGVQSRLEAVNVVRQHPELLDKVESVSEPLPVANKDGAGAGVLLVDDNRRFREQLRRMIGKIAPQVDIVEANSVSMALEQVKRHQPRLAFVDVVLGNEDGIKCTRLIRQHSLAVRIVLISAYPDKEFHRRGLQAGAAAFLDKKDLDSHSLQAILKDLFG